MTTEYVDVRTLHPEYHRDDCPDCGTERWFTDSEFDGRRVARCLECRSVKREIVEVACPDCESRMVGDGDRWHCRVCGVDRERDREALIDRLTGEFEPPGYDRGSSERCPCCDERWGVKCGPDGERVCRECDELYVGQFSDAWFAFAEWLAGSDAVRVTCA